MSQIYLAGNRLPLYIAQNFGHLQLVYNGEEMEVQSPDIPVFGLPEKPGHPVNAVRLGPGVDQRSARQIGQTERIIEFPHDQQAAVRTELQTPELPTHTTVEIQPQIVPRRRTRWVSHETSSACRPTL